jgi:hypothetical protein
MTKNLGALASGIVKQIVAPKKTEPPRGTIAEWTVTILLLLFGTTTLVQAFVIPTGSTSFLTRLPGQ